MVHAKKATTSQAPISCDTCPIGRYAVYGGLKDQRIGEVIALRRAQRTIEAGKLIFREGERPETVYTLYEGWAFKCKMLRDGSRQILAFYIPGDLMVAQAIAEAPLPFSIRAATAVTLCAFDAKGYFVAMMSNPESRKGLRDYMFQCHNETDDMLTALGRRSGTARVARLLSSLAARLEHRGLSYGGPPKIPLSQAMLADALGLTHVYVNRVIGQLRRDGTVEVGRNAILIQDLEALRVQADSD